MTQPPVPGRGPGPEPGRDAGRPGGVPGAPGGQRDPRLAEFVRHGAGDACRPGAGLGKVLDELSGPDRRCAGASDDELIGVLSRWAAQESWTAAAKLGVVRELLRRHAVPVPGTVRAGGLPEVWDEDVDHEVAPALGISLPAAGKLVVLAWTLEARLPGIGAKLADGTIDCQKAKIIAEELAVLDDEHAAAAEKLLLDDLAGKTPGQIGKLAALAVVTVDPDGARKRREHAEREQARVRFWRENTGASALAAYGLPTDAALSANANINQRAREYKQAGAAPGARMDQLRVLAFLDILNGISAADRIAQAGGAPDVTQDQAGHGGTGKARKPRSDEHSPGEHSPGEDGDDGRDGEPGNRDRADNDEDPRDDGPADGSRDDGSDPGDRDPSAGGPVDGGPGDGSPGDSGPVTAADTADPAGHRASRGNGGDSGAGPGLAAKVNLTISLATLLGLAERPGEGHGLGPLDPALSRDLAAAAARNPRSEWCVTVTSPEGFAIGHGCARPARKTRGLSRTTKPHAPGTGNRDGPPAFTPRDDPGPPDGYGTWTLTLPDGRELTVQLGPVPVTECDHRYESQSYQPSHTLRHLIEIRDGECTFPSCSRHASGCDFEHAAPYDQGGRTCACNAGARSRRCHRVKQSKGWKLTQPRPGWHQWTTPAGRVYTQGPKRYPA